MVVRIGSNLLSLNVQRQLGRATEDLSAVSQRLSSGQRINKASDDAAGLAIATSLRTNSRIYAQGIRNLNDGISQLNIAESALSSLTSITDRIQELATQSMSGTFGDTQRGSMQREVTALQSEWNRIVESTSFNGTNLLTGTNTRTVLQGGKGVEGTLAVQIGKASVGDPNDLTRAGLTTRIDTDSAGVVGNGFTEALSISADGRFVVLISSATNLVSGDSNGAADLFLKDTQSGVTTLVSINSAGVQANSGAGGGRISSNGRYVAFNSFSTNLVVGDTNGANDVFLKDTLTGAVSIVSTDSLGNQGDVNANFGAISADGRYVMFSSSSSNFVTGDTNGETDIFVKDTVTGTTRRVNTDSNGNEANSFSSGLGMSGDGRYVLFSSNASNLVAGDTNGFQDLFVKDTITGMTTRVSTDSAGTQANAASSIGTISSDGRFVVFGTTASNLVAGDNNGFQDAFMKDLQTGITSRISVDNVGTEANSASLAWAISADGRYAAFDSIASNLVPGDTIGSFDSFIRDNTTGAISRITGEGTGIDSANIPRTLALSADGRYAVTHQILGSAAYLIDLTKAGVQTMSGMVVSNRASASITLNLVQRFRDELTDYRANLGATTSRVGVFINTLQATNINTQAAESRISDADVALDAATATAAQIRQQVSASLLGQANLAPQIGLRLLQNA